MGEKDEADYPHGLAVGHLQVRSNRRNRSECGGDVENVKELRKTEYRKQQVLSPARINL